MLKEAKITPTGFEHDREWMVVNQDGWFVTQRQYPRMALIRPTIIDNGVRLSAPDMPDIDVPIAGKDARTISVKVWDDRPQAADQGDEVAAWLSTYLGRKCRLVRMVGQRSLDQKYQTDKAEGVSFADSFPFLLTSQASLDDLNARMEAPVPITRFRPNIVVGGGTAFQEDNWKRVRIGDVTFRLPKPCSRCEMITIDQKTAIKDIEPMETLGTFRYRTKGIMFGQNAIADGLGVIRVGDDVAAID